MFDRYQLDTTMTAVEYGGECPGMFETYGQDLETVLAVARVHPHRVWTLVDTDTGEPIWLNGYRRVNRILYAITTTDGQPNEEFTL